MALKKFRPKPRKGAVKRIKVSNGGDLSKGKLMINRINKAHRNINKSRTRLLKAKRPTVLSKTLRKLKKII